jgi:hypothetical protein
VNSSFTRCGKGTQALASNAAIAITIAIARNALWTRFIGQY